MHYLSKDIQHLRIKPAGARTFRTGRVTGNCLKTVQVECAVLVQDRPSG